MKQEILNSKKQVLNKMALMQTFKAIWAEDQKSKQFKLMVEGTLKGETMQKSGLTEADWKRIATMLENTVKPIKDDIQILKEDMQNVKGDIHILKDDMKNVKTDVKNLKDDMQNVKADIKAIKSCPTIKKELKK